MLHIVWIVILLEAAATVSWRVGMSCGVHRAPEMSAGVVLAAVAAKGFAAVHAREHRIARLCAAATSTSLPVVFGTVLAHLRGAAVAGPHLVTRARGATALPARRAVMFSALLAEAQATSFARHPVFGAVLAHMRPAFIARQHLLARARGATALPARRAVVLCASFAEARATTFAASTPSAVELAASSAERHAAWLFVKTIVVYGFWCAYEYDVCSLVNNRQMQQRTCTCTGTGNYTVNER